MCEPIAIASAVGGLINIASAVTGAIGQQQAHEANEKAAKDARRHEIAALGKRQFQEEQSAALTIMQADRQAREADALARVSAGEAGVAGASVDALLGSIERDRLDTETIIKLNAKNTTDQLEMEKTAAYAREKNRINGVPEANPFVTGLKIAGAGLGAVNDYNSLLPNIKSS